MNKQPGAIIIEGHVQGLSNTHSLGESGISVFVMDTHDCVARYSKYCKKFFKCPPFDSDELADFLIRLADEHNLEGWLLMPSNDHAVLTISRNKKQLEKYFEAITPGLDIIENIYDKSKLIKVAEETGVPVPETYYAPNTKIESFDLAFPVITKGKQGLNFAKATGRKAFLANDTDEFKEQLEHIEKTVPITNTFTQEVIPDNGINKTVSYAAFCENGEIKAYWMGIKLREHPLRFGTATFAESVFIDECHRQSVPLLKALSYTGVCEVEYIQDPRDNRYKLIEINARTWLWVELAKRCGVDFAKIAYDYVNGNKINYPKSYDIGVKWINPFSDTAYSLMAIFKGKLGAKRYLSSLIKGKTISALFYKKDILPGIQYLLKIFYFLKNR